jgi:hypothetical protein
MALSGVQQSREMHFDRTEGQDHSRQIAKIEIMSECA